MDPVSGFLADVNEILLGGRTFNGQKVGMDGRISSEYKICNTAMDDNPLSFLMGGEAKWVFGSFKSAAKWAAQLSERGWTTDLITEAITKGKSFDAVNMVNKANPALRYVSPTNGQSIVIDKVTKELLHVGGPGFKY